MPRFQIAFRLLCSFVFIGTGCQPATSSAEMNNAQTLKHLVGPTGRKYWDEVYATDVDGHYQRSVNQDGRFARCLQFDSSRRLMHYYYQDTVRLFDAGCNNDVQTNPDRFTIAGDTIRWLANQTYVIKYMSEEIMVLKHVPSTNPRAFDVYQKSAIQDKVVVACKP